MDSFVDYIVGCRRLGSCEQRDTAAWLSLLLGVTSCCDEDWHGNIAQNHLVIMYEPQRDISVAGLAP